jgi:hypothetical protein
MTYNSFIVNGALYATGGSSTDWNTAYGWGNHAGNYLPLSGGTLTGAITSTVTNTGDATLLTLHHDTGADLAQQKSFIDFSFADTNTNETPQVRIGAEVGQNANADSQIKEGSGAFLVYTNNADTISGSAGASLAERAFIRFSYFRTSGNAD